MTVTASRQDTGVAELLDGLRATSLDAVLEVADLQTRVDRKYLLPLPVFRTMVAAVAADYSVLQIGGLRLFRYESIYFDTPDLVAYLHHAHGRRRRFKVRTRTYLDSSECLLEVKTKSGRGATVKSRWPYPMDQRDQLTPEALALVTEHTDDHEAASRLRPVLTTYYQRATLVDLVNGSRLTCDVGLAFGSEQAERSTRHDLVLVESKTAGRASPVDTCLWQLGHRPVSVSKYCVGMALLNTDLPANRWNRELRTHFGWLPGPLAPPLV